MARLQRLGTPYCRALRWEQNRTSVTVRLALKVTWDASILDLNEVAGRREITRLESLAVNGRSTRCSCRAVGQQCFDVLVVLHAPVPASTNRLHIGLDIEH